MTDRPATTTAASIIRMQDGPAGQSYALRADIGTRWSRFSDQELADLKDNDDLVAQLTAKYGLEKDAALREAARVVQGRAF